MGLVSYTTTGGEIREGMLFLNKTIALYGGSGILFDNDSDTTISAKVANTLEFKIAGAVDWTMTLNVLTMSAAAKIAGGGTNVAVFTPLKAFESITDSVASDVSVPVTKWTTTGAATSTLADGAAIGQQKKIIMVVDGGDGVLTPATLAVGTTVTYADAGDWVLFGWETGGWVVLDSGNTVDGISSPAIA